MALLSLFFTACEKPQDQKEPKITIELRTMTSSSVSFAVVAENAEKGAYMVIPASDVAEQVPSADVVLKDGKTLDVTASAEYTEEGLEPATSYTIVVAATGNGKTVSKTAEALTLDYTPAEYTFEFVKAEFVKSDADVLEYGKYTICLSNEEGNAKLYLNLIPERLTATLPGGVYTFAAETGNVLEEYSYMQIEIDDTQICGFISGAVTVTLAESGDYTFAVELVADQSEEFNRTDRILGSYAGAIEGLTPLTEKSIKPTKAIAEKIENGTYTIVLGGGYDADYKYYDVEMVLKADASVKYLPSGTYEMEAGSKTYYPKEWGSQYEYEILKGIAYVEVKDGIYTISTEFIIKTAEETILFNSVAYEGPIMKMPGEEPEKIEMVLDNATITGVENGVFDIKFEGYTPAYTHSYEVKVKLASGTEQKTLKAGTYEIGKNNFADVKYTIMSPYYEFMADITSGTITVSETEGTYTIVFDLQGKEQNSPVEAVFTGTYEGVPAGMPADDKTIDVTITQVSLNDFNLDGDGKCRLYIGANDNGNWIDMTLYIYIAPDATDIAAGDYVVRESTDPFTVHTDSYMSIYGGDNGGSYNFNGGTVRIEKGDEGKYTFTLDMKGYETSAVYNTYFFKSNAFTTTLSFE